LYWVIAIEREGARKGHLQHLEGKKRSKLGHERGEGGYTSFRERVKDLAKRKEIA